MAVLQADRLQLIAELQQRSDAHAGLVTGSQVATGVGIGHPGGDEYAAIVGLQFELQDFTSTEASGDGKFAPIQGMKRVVNFEAARIAGIVVV